LRSALNAIRKFHGQEEIDAKAEAWLRGRIRRARRFVDAGRTVGSDMIG
jgi:hypothetical protein